MSVLRPKGEWMGEALKAATKVVPTLQKHEDEMRDFQRLTGSDREIMKNALFGGSKQSNMRPIADWPLEVASVLMKTNPEIFLDTTGKTMLAFLETEEGKRYKI